MLTQVDAEFVFNASGEPIKTSFLSLDLLTMAKVMGITMQKSWGLRAEATKSDTQPVDDGNMYKFMDTISEQNRRILAKLEAQDIELAAIKQNQIDSSLAIAEHVSKEIDLGVRDIKGVAAGMTQGEIDGLTTQDWNLLQTQLEEMSLFNLRDDSHRMLQRTTNLYNNLEQLISDVAYSDPTTYDFFAETCPYVSYFPTS